jgi:hypothetical protein
VWLSGVSAALPAIYIPRLRNAPVFDDEYLNRVEPMQDIGSAIRLGPGDPHPPRW